jgi:predicted metal-dependent phosphotriesterase family hydrolase
MPHSQSACLMTVTGPIPPQDSGSFLPHEHIMSTFGADSARYPQYDLDALFTATLPYLEQLKALGCWGLADCTAAYFGRHPELLRRISQQTGMHILTNTGYYAAADDRYVPVHAYTESAEEIAARWTYEWHYGIDGTDIYPGFIKTAVDEGALSEIDRKLLIAAVLTHRQTGLTIQTHTGANIAAAVEMLAILSHLGVHPSAWIWVHAHAVQDLHPLFSAAWQGAWISLDGLNESSAAHILSILTAFKQRGWLERILLSHDGDSYCNGDFRSYDYLFKTFIPTLTAQGFSAADLHQLTVENPRRAFTVGVKSLA